MKSTCRRKLLNELTKIKQKPQNQSCSQAILISDEKGTQVLKQLLTLQNLLDIGIKNLTKISVIKKPQPNVIGIYFISQQSIKLIEKDFSSKPTYFSINILVCEEVSQDVMKFLANSEKITERLSTLTQLHFPVVYYSEQLAVIPHSQTFLKSVYNQQGNIAQQIGQKVFQTINASFNNLNQLQIYYSDQSKFSISLGTRVHKCFEGLTKNNSDEDVQLSNISMVNGNKKVDESDDLTVILFDRAIDWVSPIVRNFYYFPMVADVFAITDFRALKIQNLSKQVESVTIQQSDQVFHTFKNQHISQAIQSITKEFQNFTASNKAAKFQKQKQTSATNKQLKDVIKGLPQYTKTLKNYNLHIEIMRELSNKSKKQKLSEIGELQHLIITSLTSQAEVEKDKKILKKTMQYLANVIDSQVKARMVYLMLHCLEISQKQKQDLLKFFEKTPGYEKFHLLFDKPVTGKLRYNPLFKKESIYLDRHECIIAKRCQQILIQKPAKQFKKLEIEFQSQGKFSKFKKMQKKSRKKLLVVMIGGLSINEISNVQRVVYKLDTHDVFFLTDHVTSPKIFIEDLKVLVNQKK